MSKFFTALLKTQLTNDCLLSTQLKKQKLSLLFFLFFFFFPFTESLIHAKVIFQGIPKKLQLQIEKKFSLKKKNRLHPYQIDLVIKKIMQTGSYERVYAFLNKNQNTVFIAYPLKKIKSFSIQGNQTFSKKIIQNILNLKVKEIYRPQKILQAIKNLKNFYREEGYHKIEVQLNKKKKKNSIHLTFNIKENSPALITEIQIETKNLKLKKKLSSYLKKFKKKRFSKNLKESIERQCFEFFKKNLFFSSQIYQTHTIYKKQKKEVQLHYKILNPYQYKLKLKGNLRFSDETLKSIAQFKEMQILDLNFISKISKKIKDHYLKYGYTHIEIDQKIKEDQTSFERSIIFSIYEGPRVKLKNIDVFGDISRPSAYYSNLIIKKSTDLLKRGFYIKKDLEIGLSRMLSHLRNEGYLNAEVYSKRIEFQESRKTAYALVFLSEGPQFKIHSIHILGNRLIPKKDILKVIQLKKNNPLKQNQIIQSIKNIKELYKNRGFLEIKLLNEKELLTYTGEALSSKIFFKIKEGPKVVVSSIIIRGNRLTRKKVILKILKIKKGETLTPKKLTNATSRLNRTGLFSKVSLKTLEENTNISNRTLVLNVAERNPGLIKLGLGFNNERDLTMRGFTRISYNNLFGTARNLSSRLEGFWNIKEINYLENSLFLNYTEPFLFGTLIRGRLNFIRSERVFNFLTQYDSFLIKRSNQIEAFLEQSLNNHLTAKWIVYGLSANNDFLFPERKNRERISTNQRLSYIGFQWDIDYLNNFFSPTKGFFTRISTRYTAPQFGSSKGIEFMKTEGRISFYIPLGSSHKFVFAQSLRGGYIENKSLKKNSGIPTSQIFVLGGASSIRGFGGRERIPSEKELPFESINHLIITGKNMYYLGKSEIRFPIYKNFGGVLFYDAGEVIVFQKNQGKQKFEKPLRQSIGFGGRIQTPVAPIAFDLGCKIKPLKNESKCQFHLSIGIL